MSSNPFANLNENPFAVSLPNLIDDWQIQNDFYPIGSIHSQSAEKYQ